MTVYQGVLRNNKQSYQVERLNLTDLDRILHLQSTVYKQLQDKSKLQQLTREEFNFILSGNGLMIGAVVNEELIAIRALLVPKKDPDHLGLAIGLSYDELDQVIYQEISFVHPDFQGNGLQQKLATLIMNELERDDHTFTHVCATVAPDNVPSLLDKFRQGMYIQALIRVYDGKLRYVFVKKIPSENAQYKTTETTKVLLKDTESSEELLDQEYVGVDLIKKEKEYKIEFKRLNS